MLTRLGLTPVYVHVCSQTVHIRRGREHTRTGNRSESGFESLREAPLNLSISHSQMVNLQRASEISTRSLASSLCPCPLASFD